MAKFLTTLTTTWVDDVVAKVAYRPLEYQSDVAAQVFIVPVGFYTDFESMIRWVPTLYALLGDHAHAPAVVHDWLYYSAKTNRKMADEVFFEAMGVIGVPLWKRRLIWSGLRMGGWVAWNKHRKEGHPLEGKFANSFTPT